MWHILILATAGATFISGPQTHLTAADALDLGIELIARNFEYEIMDAPAPVFLTLNLDRFQACEVRGVELNIKNSLGEEIFGTGISISNGVYPFRLHREFLYTTEILIGCDSGPDIFDHVYFMNLGESVQDI